MNSRLTYLLSGLMLLSSTLRSQTYEAEIKSMFASQDDVDFVVTSENNGLTFTMQFYINNDTLFEGYSRKIALADIDYSAIDVYKNVFNTIDGNYPYVLTLKPRAGKYTYSYGTAVNSKIEMYLPNQRFAAATFAFLELKSEGGYANNNSTSAIDPAEICKSTVTFLNDLYTTNYSNYLGNLIPGDNDFRYYQSNIYFPHAILTSIADTNMFSTYYRGAEILMMEETGSTQNVSSEMLALYHELTDIFKRCLESNGFEYTNRDADPLANSKLRSDFTKFAPIDQSALFASLQERRGLLVHLRVMQNMIENGSYSNKLYIYFKAQ